MKLFCSLFFQDSCRKSDINQAVLSRGIHYLDHRLMTDFCIGADNHRRVGQCLRLFIQCCADSRNFGVYQGFITNINLFVGVDPDQDGGPALSPPALPKPPARLS